LHLGFRLLILAACVPLIVPPGVCLCDAPERDDSAVPGLVCRHDSSPVRHSPHDTRHRHQHDHSEPCCCIGDLGLDEDDCVQPAPVFALVCDVPVAFAKLLIEDCARPPLPEGLAIPSGLPRYLTHLALLI
jgi:hypothetical protein